MSLAPKSYLCLVFVFTAASVAAAGTTLMGYSPAAADRERGWESKYVATPSPSVARETMQRLSARPHHLGSPYDKDNAEWILQRFRSWGFDAHIETFKVLFPSPADRAVELVAPTRFTARLQEPPVPGDPTSGQQSEQLPTYNAYSCDGDVTAPLVYVNYGTQDDYEQLDRLGVSAKGAIVIARYGAIFRGMKPKIAAEHGAVGCLIYSDPRDDGYFQGDVYPKGAFRPPDGVQRGSVMDIGLYSGDPLTPDIGATENARRLTLKDARVITRIPTLPLSYADAQPLLAALAGPMAPDAWRGALPIPYHAGPGPAKVHLKVASHWNLVPLYDVIARIPGAEAPDEWVIRGNHFDAWVNGAEDPISGQAALLEEARSFGELLKAGWRPRRTLYYCAWDGEEEGLFGSTEWAETHADDLRRHAAVYVNSDGNTRGYLSAGGSHSLERFVNGVASDVQDPETKLTVWKRLQAERILKASLPDARQEARSRPDLRISALGSGSDYTPFLEHLGIASLSLEYGGEDEGGVYHSVYDDFYWYTHFSDTDFVYGRALAQTAGLAMLRLADAPVLPFEFTDLADTLSRYADELQKLLKTKQDEARERNKELEDGVFTATIDPRHRTVPPPSEAVPPFLNFAPLQNALELLHKSADRYGAAAASAGSGPAPSVLAALNQHLIESERRLVDPDGLPGRPWYRHAIYAPGAYTGYGAKTMPGVREAIEQKRWAEADAQIIRVAGRIEDEAALIDSATRTLERREGVASPGTPTHPPTASSRGG